METPFEREMRIVRERTGRMNEAMQTFERLFRKHFERSPEEEQADERAEHAYRLSREPEEGDYANWPETLDEIYTPEECK